MRRRPVVKFVVSLWCGAAFLAGLDAAAPVASPEGVAGPAALIDLKGAWVMPGFIDAHVHFGDIAAALRALLTGSTTVRTMHVEHFLDVE